MKKKEVEVKNTDLENDKEPEKTKSNPAVTFIKKMMLFINRFKYKIKKKTIIIAVIAIIILISLFIGVKVLLDLSAQSTNKTTQNIIANDIQVVIPSDAYTYKKEVSISEINPNSTEYQNLKSMYNFYGKIYKIDPKDGKEDSSFVPMIIRYKIPNEIYFGDNYTHFSLAYSSESNPPVVSEFSGCRIIKEGSSYYVEAETFHFSKVGLVVKSAKESTYGLRTVTERAPGIEPDIIVISGTDLNFSGYLSNTSTAENPYGQSLWAALFPNRSIWSYSYPMVDTKSKVYYDSYSGYVNRTGNSSYIEFEAKRFIQELKRLPNREFDIIANSVGGLIARYALESDPTIHNVKNIVLIDVPNKGTNLANPLFYNFFYGKDPKLLAKLFSISERTIISVSHNVGSFLEQVNSYYRELLPNSRFIKNLNSLGVRNDIRYMSITGNNPKIDEDLSDSEILRFYPEFQKDTGDGLVTQTSALLPQSSKVLISPDYSYDIYNNQEVLLSIKDFLDESVPDLKVKPFEDDSFIESTKPVVLPTQPASKTDSQKPLVVPYKYFTLPKSYSYSQLMSEPKVVGVLNESTVKLVYAENSILLETFNGIYSQSLKKILNQKLFGGSIIDGKYYAATDEGVFVYDQTSTEFKKIDDIVPISDEAYYISKGNLLSVVHSGNISNIYLGNLLLSSDAKLIKVKTIGQSVYLLFDSKISKLTGTKLTTIVDKKNMALKLNVSIDIFSDFELSGSLIFILTNDYKLFMYDPQNNKQQIIGSSDLGRLKLSNYQNKKLFVFGGDITTYIDIENRVFPGIYNRMEKDIFDICLTPSGTLYGIYNTQEGKILWTSALKE